MARERRFRGFTLAHVELVETREDGTVAMIGLSGAGDAVAMLVHPEALDELVGRLQACRRSVSVDDGPNPLPAHGLA